ncbi:MAG: SufD family Fe-S cluster assembly protein [Bacilli bacterium]|nr:SufD family Fe-S cluster assembly protein [Bacilli bacterium]
MNKLYKDRKVINIIDDNTNLKIEVEKDNMIIINCFFDNIQDMQIDVKQFDDSYLVINYAGFIRENANVNINVDVIGNNNKTVVNTRTISQKNHATFEVKIKANESTQNNDIIEDLKAINEEGTVTFLPVLQVDTKEVNASHFATIGGFDKNELFYLESKGLSTNKAKDILKRSFIENLFSDNFLKMLNDRKEEHE